MQEEIFGPDPARCSGSADPTEAKAFIGARPKPLALYVFAQRGDVVDDIVEHTTSGGVCVNQTLMHLVPADLPFGGVGDSGTGAYHGAPASTPSATTRACCASPPAGPALLYPPYGPLVERLVRRMVK